MEEEVAVADGITDGVVLELFEEKERKKEEEGVGFGLDFDKDEGVGISVFLQFGNIRNMLKSVKGRSESSVGDNSKGLTIYTVYHRPILCANTCKSLFQVVKI